MMNTFRSILTFTAATCAAASYAATQFDVTVANPSAAPRNAVGVTLPVKGMFWGKTLPLASVKIDGTDIPWQIDDTDGDGRPDELAFTVDLPAKAEVTAKVTICEGTDGSQFKPSTWASLRLRDHNRRYPEAGSVTFPGSDTPRHVYDAVYGHGIMLEGSHGGIRVYADNRQSIDLYGKKSPRLELAETAFYTTPDKEAEGYGCDILWAGNSIGAGSFRAVAPDGTLFATDSVASRTQRVIASGPVRSIVEVSTPRWKVNGREYDMTQRYTIWAGHRDIEVDIYGLYGTPEGSFATGVLCLDNGDGFVSARGTAISCGTSTPDKKRPDHTETLAVGIYAPDSLVNDVREDSLNYLITLNPDAAGHISYSIAFASAKEEGAPVSLARWQACMDDIAARHRQPSTVTVSLTEPSDTVTIMMIGDSTMADKVLKGENQERGWGQMLPTLLNGPVRVDNHAVNGRSSKSFIDEGRWDKV